MNTLQPFAAIFVTGFLLCTLSLNSSMAQNPAKSSENIRTQIILRSMTARESQNFDKQLKKENQKKTSYQKVLDTLNSPGANASYGSADAMIDVAKKNKSYLLKTVKKLIKKVVNNSGKVKSMVGKAGASAKNALTALDWVDKASTAKSFFSAVVKDDTGGAAASLLNSAGSGYSAAAGGKLGMAFGTAIAGPGPGTFFGGIIGASAGALTYNEAVAPQVEKSGVYASDKISKGQAKIDNERAAISKEYKNNFDTVYPHGYMGSDIKDAVTGMRYDLRPDVLGRAAEKIRKAEEQKLGDKIDKEIKELTKQDKESFAPNKTNSKKNNGKLRITVPNVKEKSLEAAFNILKNAGFILGSPVGGDPAPSKKLVRHVQMQLPAGDQPHYQDSPVILTLYSDVEIPDVVGMNAENALKKFKKAGFSMAPEGCDPPPTKDLSLLAKEQKPAAYTPGKGYDSVTVTFYCEYQNPVTPKITTFKLSKASGILEEVGLSLSPDTQGGKPASRRDQVGKILKQQPAEGEPIEPGGEVKAWIYYTVVPKVLTMSKKDAESAMKAAWFVPNSVEGETVKNKDKWGTIYSQSLQPEDKFAETDKKVTLKFYKKPEKKNIGHPLVTHWEGKNKKNKIQVTVYWDITSIDNNGKIKGTITIPKQVVQLHNGKGNTMKMSKQQVAFHGSLKGNKITIFYEVPGAKTMLQGVWDVESMTMEGMSMVSTKLNEKWHKNGVYFYLKKK